MNTSILNKAQSVLVQILWYGDLHKKMVSTHYGSAADGNGGKRGAQFATAALPAEQAERLQFALADDGYSLVAPGCYLPTKSFRFGSVVTLTPVGELVHVTLTIP